MSLRVPSIRPDDYDPLAALCKAAGDSLRLNVLRALANDSFGVLELAQIFAIGQSGMSHHLKVLAQAGLVATRREGNAIFYRRSLPLAERTGGALHAALLEEVDERALPDDVRARIDAVHAQRAAVSQDFFARAADKFQAQQDLIAGLPQYRESVLALLDALAFAPGATALEVGPGDGGFLPELARRFRQVTALDNSAAMLELARQRCKEEGLGNVRLELADALQDAAEPADCVVLNMVLHHFAAPAEALKQFGPPGPSGRQPAGDGLVPAQPGLGQGGLRRPLVGFRTGGPGPVGRRRRAHARRESLHWFTQWLPDPGPALRQGCIRKPPHPPVM